MAYKQKAERPVVEGGTEMVSFDAYGTLVADVTSTGPLMTVPPGASGQILVSNGSSSIPSYQTPPIPQMNWQVVSADPGAPANGQVWYNSTTDLFKGYLNGGIVTFTVT